MDINSNELTKLMDTIEKVRRRKIVDTDYETPYLDPNYNIKKIQNQNNHIVIGRRGSGKTTLILASIKSITNNCIVLFDCQLVRKEKYEQIIIKLLLKIFEQIRKNICEIRAIKTGAHRKKISTKELKIFLSSIEKTVTALDVLLNMPEAVNVKKESHSASSKKKIIEKTKDFNFGLGGGANFDTSYKVLDSNLDTILKFNRNYRNSEIDCSESRTEYTSVEENEIKKYTFLENLVESFSKLFGEYKRLTGNNVSIYLDDFYQIEQDNQVYIIQYFHNIYKISRDNSFCFKVCTISSKLKINHDGENILSIRDDFSKIPLDSDLSNISAMSEYLLNILSILDDKLNITAKNIEQLFGNDDVIRTLTIASGGVPRDFLLMFVDVVNDVRKNNLESIGKQSIYSVVHKMKEDKDEYIEADIDINKEVLEESKQHLIEDIVEKKNTNVFLFSHKESEKSQLIMHNLVNLRYVHVIKEQASSENKKNEVFFAYLVDMSFYINAKQLKRAFNYRHFWERDEKSRLKHIESAPIFSLDNLVNSKEKSINNEVEENV